MLKLLPSGHVVPVQGDWPVRMKMFVIESLSK